MHTALLLVERRDNAVCLAGLTEYIVQTAVCQSAVLCCTVSDSLP